MSLRRRLAPVLLAGLMVVAGCSAEQAGAPAREASHPNDRTARAALGDLRTVDPCTMADPRALARFGAVSSAERVSLDYCLQHLRTPDGSLVQVATGELAGSEASRSSGDPIVERSSLRIAQETPVAGHCSRRVLFADGVSMRVSSDALTDGPVVGLCGIAQAAAEALITAIDGRKVGHRVFPPNSLAFIDPCTVLDSATVREIPGMERAEPRPSPSAHQCQWGEQEARSPRVRLVHTAGDPPDVLHGAAVRERIAGRDTVVSIVGGDPRAPLCSAETAHIPFGGPRQTEVAMLVVAIPGTDGIRACEFARGLAERAWPRLPAT